MEKLFISSNKSMTELARQTTRNIKFYVFRYPTPIENNPTKGWVDVDGLANSTGTDPANRMEPSFANNHGCKFVRDIQIHNPYRNVKGIIGAQATIPPEVLNYIVKPSNDLLIYSVE